ncbi:MAG: Crp/Fnr family transcriptional regulator [Leptospirales bacterium]
MSTHPMPAFDRWMRATPPDREVVLARKGEALFRQGDPSEMFYVVTEGRILFVKESPFGTPLILERLLPGEFVAGFAVIFDFPYPASAISDCPSRTVGYSKARLQSAIDSDRELRREVHTELGERFRMYQSRLLYANMPIEVRLSQVLVALSGRDPDQEGILPTLSARDSIAITRTVLAQMCLTTVETAIRVTRMWEKAGKIDLSQRGVIRILDPVFFCEQLRGLTIRG